MNLLVGFVTILCLVVCELHSQTPVDDVWTRILAMLFVTASVPGLAFFQTIVITRQIKQRDLSTEQRESSLKRLTACHWAVWLVASMMIVCSIQWQAIVRQNWGLDGWPMLDEALILMPIILSLIASWAIFYDIRRATTDSNSSMTNSFIEQVFSPDRLKFVLVRVRIYAVMTLLPVAIFVLLKDLSRFSAGFPEITFVGCVVATLLVFVGYPFFVAGIWNLQAIKDPELDLRMKQFCEEHRLYVSGVRVWNTDNQVLNAMVAGLVPRFRLIILTDAMINRFPRHELLAILRHEAGHIRLWHLPIRVSFVLLPLLVLAVGECLGVSFGTRLNSILATIGLEPTTTWLAPSIMYGAYLLATLSWLSRKMEYEADLYAVTNGPMEVAADLPADDQLNKRANDLLDALIRFASYYPQQLDRNTLMHPSLRRRMHRINRARDHLLDRKHLANTWRNQQLFFFCVLLAICCAAIIV